MPLHACDICSRGQTMKPPSIAVVCMLLMLMGALKIGQTYDGCYHNNANSIRLIMGTKREGAVQMCLKDEPYHYRWFYITATGWTNLNAGIACRNLGLEDRFAVAKNLTLSQPERTITSSLMCTAQDNQLYQCLPESWSEQQSASVAGVICDVCKEESTRLVNGANYREGRVEVCVDGRWGTVCGEDWGEEEARLVCGRLGLPKLNATLKAFGEGTGPVFECDIRKNNCTRRGRTSTCTHSNDAGVRCLAFDQACAVAVGQMTSGSNSGLGAVTGLSIIALIAVVAGWIGTCVYMWRRNNRFNSTVDRDSSSRQHHLDNPVYDGSTGPHLQTNYSSVGPAYEPVNANQGTGYDVINRGGAPRSHPPSIPTGSHNPTSDQPYSTLDHNAGDEHNYHVLESSSTGNNGGSV